MTPGDPALVRGSPPKTPVEALLVLVLAAGTPVVVVTVEVTGGSTGFPSTGGLAKLNPVGTREVLAGGALPRLVGGALLAAFVASSVWPTRSPEKLPRVSPAKELGNRSSPDLAGGVSSLLVGLESATPAGAAGLLPDRAGSPGGTLVAPVELDAAVTAEGAKLSGMVSGKGLPAPPNENVSGWLGSLAGGVAPCVAVKVEDGVGVIIPKLKPVPDEENEKGLLNCPAAGGVAVTAVSVLVAPGPEALSPDDDWPEADVGPDSFREFMSDPCLAWLLAAMGVSTGGGVLAAECDAGEPIAAEAGEGLFFSSCTFTT